MKLHPLDAAIILIYFVFAISAGIWVARRGAKDLNSYFLGGKNLPLY
jgi:SSS family solute:Na+ symporter